VDAVCGGGDDPAAMHQKMAAVMEHCITEIRAIQWRRGESRCASGASALADDYSAHAEGMDLPEGAGRAQLEGSWRAHQIPITDRLQIQRT